MRVIFFVVVVIVSATITAVAEGPYFRSLWPTIMCVNGCLPVCLCVSVCACILNHARVVVCSFEIADNTAD